MILFEMVGTEDSPLYQSLAVSNLERQYSFLRSIITASVDTGRPTLSTAIIKSLNAHAISCLHVSAGEYRPCEVTVGSHRPPEHYRVPELMNMFVNEVNAHWDNSDPVVLGAYVLWKLNYIHPFINGNGRTARSLCYFIICAKSGGILPGSPDLMELIRLNRAEYVGLLQEVDRLHASGAPEMFDNLAAFIRRLLEEQLSQTEL